MIGSAVRLCFTVCVVLADHCEMPPTWAYPPPLDPLPTGEAKLVESAVVSLDDPPATRWDEVVKPHASEIKALAGVCGPEHPNQP